MCLLTVGWDDTAPTQNLMEVEMACRHLEGSENAQIITKPPWSKHGSSDIPQNAADIFGRLYGQTKYTVGFGTRFSARIIPD